MNKKIKNTIIAITMVSWLSICLAVYFNLDKSLENKRNSEFKMLGVSLSN